MTRGEVTTVTSGTIVPKPERRCPVCGADLSDRDPRTRACSPAHRREVARLRRLLSGRADGHYRTLAQYTSRRRQVRAKRLTGA